MRMGGSLGEDSGGRVGVGDRFYMYLPSRGKDRKAWKARQVWKTWKSRQTRKTKKTKMDRKTMKVRKTRTTRKT